MDNRKKKRKKNKNRQNSNTNTPKVQKETVQADTKESAQDLEIKSSQTDNAAEVKEDVKPVERHHSDAVKTGNEKSATEKADTDSKVQNSLRASSIEKTDTGSRIATKEVTQSRLAIRKDSTESLPENAKELAMKAAKILLPAVACIIIIAVIISYMGSQKTKAVESSASGIESDGGAVTLSDGPLEENAHSSVNELMNTFYAALADGDMDTVKTLKDYNSDKEIITYEKKSEFIEYYDNVNCYTKAGIEENTYFVYVTYTVKIENIETKAPGLNAWYVYTAEDGSLRIDGDTEENIKAAFKLVTSQDDVVDLYNKIDVSYKEAVASDESLSAFMDELPVFIKTSVGEALAQLETQQDEGTDNTSQTESQISGEEQQAETTEAAGESEELPQNQVVNQIVRTTDTVNVRSSDSEEADRIGKAQAGTELTRTEDRVNGWSKIIFEGKEAYIKSDYLEVVTTEAVAEPIGTISALTNVNVRSQASQESAKLGTAQAGSSYDLLEDLGEWYKINYNGNTGFVKAEFFER